MEIVLSIFTCSLLITLLFSISVAIAFPLFKNYYNSAWEGFFPVYNLFKLCYIVGFNEFLGFLYLIPGINIILMIITGARLGNIVYTYTFFKIGFIILPIIFIPLAAYIIKREKVQVEAQQPAPATVEVEVEKFDVDASDDGYPKINLDDESIFKDRVRVKVENEGDRRPYKAKRVMVNEKFINSAPAEQETIEKVNRNGN